MDFEVSRFGLAVWPLSSMDLLVSAPFPSTVVTNVRCRILLSMCIVGSELRSSCL